MVLANYRFGLFGNSDFLGKVTLNQHITSIYLDRGYIGLKVTNLFITEGSCV